jgi:hypothetical protein
MKLLTEIYSSSIGMENAQLERIVRATHDMMEDPKISYDVYIIFSQ